MKIFLCDFSSYELKETAFQLQKKGAEILYWTGGKKYFEEASRDREKFPSVFFHNQFDAVEAVSAQGINEDDFLPPSAELISDMLECESIVLVMMNRMDFNNTPLIQKKQLYYKYLQYWNGVLNKLKPDAIIFSEIPHVVYNFVLYSLAKRRGIPTVMISISSLWGWEIIVKDYKKASEYLLEEYNKIKDEKHGVDELSPVLRDYFIKLTDTTQDSTPAFNVQTKIKMKNRLNIIFGALSVVRDVFFGISSKKSKKRFFSIIEKDNGRPYGFFKLRQAAKLKKVFEKEYSDLQSNVDFGKKYVYFPLSFQPERSTSPMADYYVDMILIARTVSAVLPKEWLLYVKEYPLQWNQHHFRSHLCRYKGYYKELAKMKNVRLVPTDISSFDLINSSQAVVTASGSAGWEAVVRGKSALLFGYPWYMYCDGIFRINSTEKCREAMKMIGDGYKPNPQRVLNYFIAFQKNTIRTNQWLRYQLSQDITQEETIKNITEAIWDELIRIKN